MDLLEVMRSESSKSKKWYRRRLVINALALIASSLAALFLNNIFIAFLLFCFPIASFISTELSLRHQGRAEQVRRLRIICDSLDYQPSQLDLKKLAFDSGEIKDTEPSFIAPYYDSTFPKGSKRLADNIAESSFFTTNEAKYAAMVYGSVVVASVLLLGFIVFLLLRTSIPDVFSDFIAQAISLVVIFLATGDFVWLTIRYFELSQQAASILEVAEILKAEDTPNDIEVFRVFDQYNCAMILCPPLPSWIYSRLRDSLNQAWRLRLTSLE